MKTIIHLVTPTFNSAATISRTIASVLSQAGDFEINYHIQDGGSKDDTVAVVQRWQQLLESKALPLSCKGITLTCESAPDKGMYDAIARGFSKLNIQPEDWMGWINSDDYLNQGAFSFLNKINNTDSLKAVNWVASSVPAVACESYLTTKPNRRLISSYLLKSGVCDGEHWDFLPQEGSFFRGVLWEKIDVQHDFVNFKYAGDWNLWRIFATTETIHLTPFALGVFNVTPGQLSADRGAYLDEINRIMPHAVRRQNFEQIVNNGATATLLRPVKWNDSSLYIDFEKFADEIKGRAEKIKVKQLQKLDFLTAPSREMPSLLAWDADWQFPAITEKHAFERMRFSQLNDSNGLYIGFPWATLIDLKNSKKDSSRFTLVLEEMEKIVRQKGSKVRVITVCQHILASKFGWLFKSIGVTDLFWSHAVKGGNYLPGYGDVRIHPFPLYPVQAIGKAVPSDEQRTLLFSFVGAKADKWYLTQARTWILELLSNHPKGVVIGRDSWHYGKVVYGHQISKTIANASTAVDSQASQEFSEILERSIFSLCPSGSGPNSIRLWESIGMGAIPVILADTWLPPGDPALWEAAAVFCAETPEAIRALPDRLEAMANNAELLASKRRAMRQLWMLYGPDCFVYDIQKLILSEPSRELQTLAAKSFPLKTTGVLKTDVLHELAQKILSKEGGASLSGDLLSMCTTRLLTNPTQFRALFEKADWLRQACRAAMQIATGQEAETFRRVCKLRGLII